MKETKNNPQLVRDPVCEMRIEPEDAADIELYKGNIFYFCASGCKEEFLKNPEQYFTYNINEEKNNEHTI